ncbi:hypothetical protein ACF3M1_02630 [Luteimonas sp. WGS1318]|uniref:hypothetical protein n=1 Tax=Luteimonas sp. WGS1318 TaxID=3366815 RepID=UPI00372D0C36
MRRLFAIIIAAISTGCVSGAMEPSAMGDTRPQASTSAAVQSFVIEGPAAATFRKQVVARSPWTHGDGPVEAWFGDLVVEGTVSIDTPPGTQYATWFNFEKRLTFVVRDLRDGSVRTTSHVDGGWNLARRGISVQMAPPPLDSVSEDDFNLQAPHGSAISRRFIYRIDDHLPDLYSAPTTLEIHAEYLGARSNAIRVEVLIDHD